MAAANTAALAVTLLKTGHIGITGTQETAVAIHNSQRHQAHPDGCAEANFLGVDVLHSNWLEGIAADFPRGEIQGASVASNCVYNVLLGETKYKNTTSGAKPNSDKPKPLNHTFMAKLVP